MLILVKIFKTTLSLVKVYENPDFGKKKNRKILVNIDKKSRFW